MQSVISIAAEFSAWSGLFQLGVVLVFYLIQAWCFYILIHCFRKFSEIFVLSVR